MQKQENDMDDDKLIIRLEQIPNGVRLTENYSKRLLECLQKDDMSGSLGILQGLISVIGEINRGYIFDVLYPMFGCSLKTMKKYLNAVAEKSNGDHLFERGHELFYDELAVEGSLPFRTDYFFEASMDPVNSVNLELKVTDGIFNQIKAGDIRSADHSAVITVAAFADTLYGELYFPAIKLLTGDSDSSKTKAFIEKTLDEQFVLMA